MKDEAITPPPKPDAWLRSNLFITNDARLSRTKAPGIDFIVPLRQVFL